MGDVTINGSADKIIPTDGSGDVYYYTSTAAAATPVKDATRSKTGSNGTEVGLYATSALTIKVEKTDEGAIKLSELLASAGSEAYKVTISEASADTHKDLRLTFVEANRYAPQSGDNVFTFTAADLLSAAGVSGDTAGYYIWNPSKTVYMSIDGGASNTAYSANHAPDASYTVEATAAANV